MHRNAHAAMLHTGDVDAAADQCAGLMALVASLNAPLVLSVCALFAACRGAQEDLHDVRARQGEQRERGMDGERQSGCRPTAR